MTTHLEWHQHAFIDENNKVILVAVFEKWAHDHQLLEDVKIANGASSIVCCCQYGLPGVGYTWTGTEFIPPKPFDSWTWNDSKKEWEAPTPMPEGALYIWDEETLSWIEV